MCKSYEVPVIYILLVVCFRVVSTGGVATKIKFGLSIALIILSCVVFGISFSQEVRMAVSELAIGILSGFVVVVATTPRCTTFFY